MAHEQRLLNENALMGASSIRETSSTLRRHLMPREAGRPDRDADSLPEPLHFLNIQSIIGRAQIRSEER